MEQKGRMIAIALAVVHTIILAAYTFPERCVPTRLRYWSQAYARVLFHQDWRLFAPDPPACSCSLEFEPGAGNKWRPLADQHHHFIWRRMASNACRYAEVSVRYQYTIHVIAPEPLARSLEDMAGVRADDSALRIHRRCPDNEDLFIHVLSLTNQ